MKKKTHKNINIQFKLFVKITPFLFFITNSQIYCYGNLLHTVQMAHLFEDSKTFVDMKLKFPPEQTFSEFQEFMTSKNNEPSQDDIRQFVNVSLFLMLSKLFNEISTSKLEKPAAFAANIVKPIIIIIKNHYCVH